MQAGMMSEEAERCEQRAQWCAEQAERWRRRGYVGLAGAYAMRGEDWRDEARRWRARQLEGGCYGAHRATGRPVSDG